MRKPILLQAIMAPAMFSFLAAFVPIVDAGQGQAAETPFDETDIKWTTDRLRQCPLAFLGKVVEHRKLGAIPAIRKDASDSITSGAMIFWARVEIITVLRNKNLIAAKFVDVLWRQKIYTDPAIVTGRRSVVLTEEDLSGKMGVWIFSDHEVEDIGTNVPLYPMCFSFGPTEILVEKAFERLRKEDEKN